MFDIFIQFDLLGQFVHVSIDLHTHITASFCLIQHLFMTSFSSAHHRCQKLDPGALRQFHDLIHHLVHRLFCDDLSTFRTVRNTDSRIQQTEIIVNLRHGSHGRTRVSVRGLLIDGDRR